jgi:hypothetical protein
VSRDQRFVEASPHDVFDVLSDGWLYPSWVVGASRIRDVELTWPAVGARIHHSFGVWPVVVDDTTSVLVWHPPHRAVLRARGWPLGEAQVTLTVHDRAGGCLVVMEEEAVTGPGALVPDAVLDPALGVRNRETLRRLAWLAEGRLRDRVSPS